MATHFIDLPNGTRILVEGPRIEVLPELGLRDIRGGVSDAEEYSANPTNKETLWKSPYHTLNDIILFSDDTPHGTAKLVMEEYPIILEEDLKDILGLDRTVRTSRTSSKHLIPDIVGLLRIWAMNPRTQKCGTILLCIGVTELKRMLSRKLTLYPISGVPRSREAAEKLGRILEDAAFQATGQLTLNIKSLRVWSQTKPDTDFPPWVPPHLYLLIGVGGWVSFATVNVRKFEIGQFSQSFEAHEGDDAVMGNRTAQTSERFNNLVQEIIDLGEGVEDSSYWVEKQGGEEGVPMELEDTNGFKPNWDRHEIYLRTNIRWSAPIYLRDQQELRRALLDWRRQILSKIIQPVARYLKPVPLEAPR